VNPSNRIQLVDFSGHLTFPREAHYLVFPFTLPAGASKVILQMTHHRQDQAQIYISLHGPMGFRGNRMNLADRGEVVTQLWIASDQAGPGGLPGELTPGEWKAQIDLDQLAEETDYHLEAYAELGPSEPAWQPSAHKSPVLSSAPGWIKGELHAHSIESDGKWQVEDVVAAAREAGLDFLAMTDHFTCSQWRRLDELHDPKIILLHSLEITSHQGHANLHGLNDWVDVYVDRAGWSMNQAADAVHAQGGLFCINHAYSSECSWRSYSFDWRKADLFEIYHNLEGPNNIYQLGLWDQLLGKGCRIVGVAGTDCHHPRQNNQQLGDLVTWVHVNEASEMGLIAGLQNGQVFVSRGGEMRFKAANCQGGEANMGGCLDSAGGPVSIEVGVRADEDLRCYVVKNGLYFRRLFVPAMPGWQKLTLQDDTPVSGYYRVEFHRIYSDPRYPGIEWRDFDTLTMLSNPIWVRAF
jgi:hypothetical protein